MATLLKITKPEAGGKYGTVHYVPNTKINKAFFDNQNKLLKESEKWTIEEVAESEAVEAAKTPGAWKNEKFITGQGAVLLAEKNAQLDEANKKLADLQLQLEAKQKEVDTKKAQAQTELEAKQKEVDTKKAQLNTSGVVNASEAITKIATLTTVEEVEAYVADENRATVVKAAQGKIEALTAPQK